MSKRWRPDAALPAARLRAAALARIRDYFAATGALEVDTPSLSHAAVSDPNIESVEARLSVAGRTPCYLHTSPEFAMKRLLAAGYPDIYQVCKVYRDGELGKRHQPEFTLIEWYRLHTHMQAIMDDTVALLAKAIERPDLAEKAVFTSYTEAFIAHAGCDPLCADLPTLAAAAEADSALRDRLGDDRNAWLDLVFEQRVVSGFAPDRFTVVAAYPAEQAALARLSENDDRLADRFEVFCGRHELANGYIELTDADEQRRRIESDQAFRAGQGYRLRPIDESFLAALQHGLPPCSGVAAGLDRLLMVAGGYEDIREVTSFAFERPSR